MTSKSALEAFKRATAARQIAPPAGQPTLSDDERALLRQYLAMMVDEGWSQQDRDEYIAGVGKAIACPEQRAGLVVGWCEALAGSAQGINERIRAGIAARKVRQK